MTIKIPKFSVLIATLCMLFFYSCAEEVDFTQAEDLLLSPVLESSLVFFDESANVFLDNGTEINVPSDFIIVDFFDNQFIKDNLIKAEFIFETLNTINRDFELRIDFYNAASELHHTFTVTEDASPTNSDVVTTYTEVFEGDVLEALKNTKVLNFTLTMLSGEAINENTLGQITLKSKAVFYFNIEG